MVLARLGTSITRALHQMSNATIVDQSVLNACLNDIIRALLQADVNIRLVKQMQDNIKRIVNFEEMAAGINKRRIVQQDLGKPPHVRSTHTIIRKKTGNQHWCAQIHSELVLLISLSRMQQKLRFHSMEAT